VNELSQKESAQQWFKQEFGTKSIRLEMRQGRQGDAPIMADARGVRAGHAGRALMSHDGP
jgi:hypothetical protein